MKYAILASAILLSACASTHEVSQNLLEKRSDYDGKYLGENASEDVKQFLIRSNKSTLSYTDIRMHPRELPTGELFLGGWLRIARTDRIPTDQQIKPQATPPSASKPASDTRKK